MNVRHEAEMVAKILSAIVAMIPPPYDLIVRVAAAAIASAAVALDQGVAEADVIARIHRVQHIDP